MLAALLWILIVVMIGCWCVPLLFLPRALLRRIQIPVTEPILFVRLLGAASLALCIHYALGARDLRRGEDPTDVVVVALLHCGMSAAIIWRYALQGHYGRWPRITRIYVYSAGAVMTALALGLLFAGLWHA